MLAVFDLDGTITRHDTLLPYLAAFLARRPWRALRLPLALPQLLRYAAGRGERGALKGALIHAVLGGVTAADIERLNARFLPRLLRTGLYAEAVALIQWHREQQHCLILLSASPDLYVPALADRLGFERSSCSTVAWRDDARLDGRLRGANCRGEEKRLRLAELQRTLAPRMTFAYGNSRADLAHLALAELGWFVNGSAKVTPPGSTVRTCRWNRSGGVTVSASGSDNQP